MVKEKSNRWFDSLGPDILLLVLKLHRWLSNWRNENSFILDIGKKLVISYLFYGHFATLVPTQQLNSPTPNTETLELLRHENQCHENKNFHVAKEQELETKGGKSHRFVNSTVHRKFKFYSSTNYIAVNERFEFHTEKKNHSICLIFNT